MNAENPKSRVIPLSWLYGFLSKLAVEVILLKIFAIDVLPLSTCPKIPILILITVFDSTFMISFSSNKNSKLFDYSIF